MKPHTHVGRGNCMCGFITDHDVELTEALDALGVCTPQSRDTAHHHITIHVGARCCHLLPHLQLGVPVLDLLNSLVNQFQACSEHQHFTGQQVAHLSWQVGEAYSFPQSCAHYHQHLSHTRHVFAEDRIQAVVLIVA